MDHINLDEAEAFGDLISSYKNVRHLFRTCASCGLFDLAAYNLFGMSRNQSSNSIGSESCIDQVFC